MLEACFLRLAAGTVENVPRARLPFEGGSFALMAAVDRELGYAGAKTYAVVEGRAAFVLCLFGLETGTLEAVIEADALGRCRTGAASGVAAKHLARAGARTLGVIGCGGQARAQVEAIRAAVPAIDSVRRVVPDARSGSPRSVRPRAPSRPRARRKRPPWTSSSRSRPHATRCSGATG